MLEPIRQDAVEEPTERHPGSGDRAGSKSAVTSVAFRTGRLLYGGVLTMMAIDGLRNAKERAQYAEAKNVPVPKLATDVSHSLLLFGGLGIALWRAPSIAAGAVVTFFAGTTPAMHDFWAVDDPEQTQQQQIHFLKNAALLGTALVLLGVAETGE